MLKHQFHRSKLQTEFQSILLPYQRQRLLLRQSPWRRRQVLRLRLSLCKLKHQFHRSQLQKQFQSELQQQQQGKQMMSRYKLKIPQV